MYLIQNLNIPRSFTPTSLLIIMYSSENLVLLQHTKVGGHYFGTHALLPLVDTHYKTWTFHDRLPQPLWIIVYFFFPNCWFSRNIKVRGHILVHSYSQELTLFSPSSSVYSLFWTPKNKCTQKHPHPLTVQCLITVRCFSPLFSWCSWQSSWRSSQVYCWIHKNVWDSFKPRQPSAFILLTLHSAWWSLHCWFHRLWWWGHSYSPVCLFWELA